MSTAYHIYKNGAFHSKTWNVSTTLQDLREYHTDVTLLPARLGEYMRFKAGNAVYIAFDRYMGMTLNQHNQKQRGIFEMTTKKESNPIYRDSNVAFTDINGHKVHYRGTAYNNEFIVLVGDDCEVCFYSESLQGRNYCKVLWVYNSKKEKFYHASRYHLKYISIVSGISGSLFVEYFKQGKQFQSYIKGE